MNSRDDSLPPLIPTQMLAAVVSLQNVAPQHFQLSLSAPQIAQSAQAGQFIHVLPRESSSLDPLLRRAFSIMACRDEIIDILFRVEGKGTKNISRLRVGDCLDVLGPLGRPFDRRLFHVKQLNETAPKPILIGGGVGVPPMIFLGKTFKDAGYEPLMIVGARSARDVLGLEEFSKMGIQTQVVTDDGSLGQAGRVTDVLETELQNPMLKSSASADQSAVIYSCGPLPMLRAVASLAARFGVPCQVSLEENMPCGIGVCNGCVVAMRTGLGDGMGNKGSESSYERYHRVCVAGPAVWASDVDWEAM